MKKMAIRLREIGLPTSGTKPLGLDLEALVQRQVAAFVDGVERGQRAGNWPLGLASGPGRGPRRR